MTFRSRFSGTRSLDRRQLLQTAAAGALIATVPGYGRVANAAGHGPIEMKVVLAEVDTPGLKLRTYNGLTPGPTLSVSPNESLEVNVINTLTAQSADEFCPAIHNKYHANNSTNLHTHGLHVSPYKATDGRDSDNIFLTIVPDGQEVPPACDSAEIRKVEAMFNFQLPDDHPSGTFWYHAHKHGSTAQQVANGLVGPLIVRDKPGVMPSYIENAPEDILMVQMRGIKKDTPAPGDDENKGEPHLVLVDSSGNGGGTIDPTITMRPGEVRRWRIINAAPRADTFVSLNLVGVDGGEALEVYQIAYDGITYEKRIMIDTTNNGVPWKNPAALAPGNRTDFMVRVPPDAAPGEMQLVALQLPNEMILGTQAKAVDKPSTEMTLNIKIEGSPVDAEWSDDPTLPGGGPLVAPIDPKEVVYDRTVEFFLKFGEGIETEFMIDGQEFDGSVLQPPMKLDTVERWTVTNRNTFTHPFHIHVNPFFVTHLYGKELPDGHPLRRWQDTMAIPVAAATDVDPAGSFTMLSRFVKFTGKFVIHCHILEHEDEGMMHAVEVVS